MAPASAPSLGGGKGGLPAGGSKGPPSTVRSGTGRSSSNPQASKRGPGKSSPRGSAAGKKAGGKGEPTLGSISEGASAPAGAPSARNAPASGSANGSGGKTPSKRPHGASRLSSSVLKVVTTGPTAVVDFVDEADEPKRANAQPARADADGDGGSGAASKQVWTARRWLKEVENLQDCIADCICVDDRGVPLEDEEALVQVRALDSKDALLHKLLTHKIAAKLADAIWPKLEILRAGPATASELATQWKAEDAGELLYGGLPAFFSGLELRIGSPNPNILRDMQADHCDRADSRIEFKTGNYSVVTTSEVEWKFVVQPETPLRWPIEERLTTEGKKDHMRKLLPEEILRRRMEAERELAGSG